MTAVLSDLDARPDWRATAGVDSPAGPLFSDRYAEADLAMQDPMAIGCSLATGSSMIPCCA